MLKTTETNRRWSGAVLAWLLAASLSGQSAAQDGSAAAVELSEQDMKRGKILFLQCRACHALTPGDNGGKIGPTLAGLFGREAGSADFYDGYSTGLREAGHVWNAESLDLWLKSPSTMVPGTSMVFAGIADEQQRATLVRYLQATTAAE
jgi:cytochrome c